MMYTDRDFRILNKRMMAQQAVKRASVADLWILRDEIDQELAERGA